MTDTTCACGHWHLRSPCPRCEPLTPAMERAMAVGCPKCGASPGVVCYRVGRHVQYLKAPHAVRTAVLPSLGRCAAYTEQGQHLARGGKRLTRCTREALTSRAKKHATVAHTTERTYSLCGHHAAQWDRAERGEGWPPNLESDVRR